MKWKGTKEKDLKMRKICAWCKKDMGATPSGNNTDGIVSHGICEECVDRIFAQQQEGVSPLFFDNFGMPVAVINAERKANVWFKKK